MTVGQHERGWGTVLRRQRADIVDKRPEGGYTDAFEIICCDCGDDPGMDYREASPRHRLVRGPYPIVVGLAAYEIHIEWHERAAQETGSRPPRPAPSCR